MSGRITPTKPLPAEVVFFNDAIGVKLTSKDETLMLGADAAPVLFDVLLPQPTATSESTLAHAAKEKPLSLRNAIYLLPPHCTLPAAFFPAVRGESAPAAGLLSRSENIPQPAEFVKRATDR